LQPKTYRVVCLIAALTAGILSPPVQGQTESGAQDPLRTITGTVISSSANTLTVKSNSGFYTVFVFDRDTRKPSALPPGTSVAVISAPTSEQGVRTANEVVVTTATPAQSEGAGQDSVLTITGTVTSSSGNSMTVRSNSGLYTVFVFDRDTRKPKTLPAGTSVTVISTPTGEPGLRAATDVLVTTAGSTQSDGAERAAHPYESGEAVPASVRKLESSIEHQSKKFALGFRTGVGLDPELLLLGVQARIGPLFGRDLSFRPNLDFGFGEVTKMFVLDLNVVHRLPLNARQSKWSMFVGAGPALSFIHRNFEEAAAGDNGIDFGEFKYQSGLNILAGAEFRSGFFVEAKTTVWAGPHLRLSVGYSF